MKTMNNLDKAKVGLYAIADEPVAKCVYLTANRVYKVLSYFEFEGDKLFLVKDDNSELSSYNICHFTSIEMKTSLEYTPLQQEKKDVYLEVDLTVQEFLDALRDDRRTFYSYNGEEQYVYPWDSAVIQTRYLDDTGRYIWLRDGVSNESFDKGIYIKQ